MLLSNVIAAHKRTTKTSRELLFNYVAARLWKREEAEEIAARFIKVEVAGTADLPPPVNIALELTAMRRRMAAGLPRAGHSGPIYVRVCRPDTQGLPKKGGGHLQAGKPVYIAGGFGGCAGTGWPGVWW